MRSTLTKEKKVLPKRGYIDKEHQDEKVTLQQIPMRKQKFFSGKKKRKKEDIWFHFLKGSWIEK